MVDPSPEKEGGFGMMIPAKDGGPTLAQKEEQAIAGQELTVSCSLIYTSIKILSSISNWMGTLYILRRYIYIYICVYIIV